MRRIAQILAVAAILAAGTQARADVNVWFGAVFSNVCESFGYTVRYSEPVTVWTYEPQPVIVRQYTYVVPSTPVYVQPYYGYRRPVVIQNNYYTVRPAPRTFGMPRPGNDRDDRPGVTQFGHWRYTPVQNPYGITQYRRIYVQPDGHPGGHR